MSIVKYSRVLLLFLLSMILVSCGGGGSSSSSSLGEVPFSLDTNLDGAGSKYRGLKEAAQLSPDNSLFFLESLFGFSSGSNSQVNKVKTLAQVGYIQKRGNVSATLNRAVSDERSGHISGSVKLTGDINDRGQGVVVSEWKNFSDVEGELINGKAILNVVEYDIQRNLIIKSTTKLVDLENTENGKTIVSNGYVVEEIILAEGKATTIWDMAFYDENSNFWKAYDKLKIVQFSGIPVEGGAALDYQVKEEITGRLYREDMGFIDIRTSEPLLACSDCEPLRPVEGELRFSDKDNDSAIFSFSDALQFNLKFVDATQTESQRASDWREMNSWVHLNSSPYEPIAFFEVIPRANKDAVIAISTRSPSDSDGDEVSIIATWKVNGVVIEGNSSNTLAHSHYKALDTIEVSVVSVDIYGGRSTAAVRTTLVPNTAPTIVVSDVVFTIGETMTLDASNTTDTDGQTLVFSWELHNTHLPESLITIVDPDKAKTEVTVPASGIYQFRVQVKEKNANGELIEGSFYADDVTLTVLPEDIYRPSEALPDFVGFAGALRVADVSGDGLEDVVLSKFGKLEIKNFANNSLSSVYLGNSSYRAHTILIKDLNNDGLNDFIVDQEKGFIVSKQTTIGDFGPFPSEHFSQTHFNNTVNQIQTGHFNNDNLLDVVLLFNTSIEVFIQKEPPTEPPPQEDLALPPIDDTVFQSPVVYSFSNNTSLTPFQSTKMRIADVTGDSLDDIILITPLDNNDYSSLVLLKQKSTGGFESKQIIHPEIHYAEGDALGLVDLNGDQRLDIVVAHNLIQNSGAHNGGLEIYYQSSTGDFDQLETKATEAFGNQILIRDINKDGNSDLIINNGDRYTIHKQKADKHLSPFWSVYDFVNSVNKFDIGDINADGKLDIVAENDGLIHVRYGK